MSDAWWSLPLTVVAYLLARRLAARINLSIVNPLLVLWRSLFHCCC